VPGATDAQGQPINGLGHVRAYGAVADCCKAAPSVLEFDSGGKLLRAWGGPSDPGFIGGKCKADAGCIWPTTEHGIYIDQNDNVWLSGSSAASAGQGGAGALPWATNKDGGDGFVLKFDMNGNFKMRIGGTPRGANSNDTRGGINDTPVLYQAADMVVDPATNRLYIADGYGNRRVLMVDANTGRYIGHFGAYGNNPVDDSAARAAGPWIADYSKGQMTARSMSATAGMIAFKSSTRMIRRLASRATIRAEQPESVDSLQSNSSATTPTSLERQSP
jgi:hypothetical protein